MSREFFYRARCIKQINILGTIISPGQIVKVFPIPPPSKKLPSNWRINSLPKAITSLDLAQHFTVLQPDYLMRGESN